MPPHSYLILSDGKWRCGGTWLEAHSIGSIYESRGQQTYFINVYPVNSLGFAGCMVCVATIQLCCHYQLRSHRQYVNKWVWSCSNEIVFTQTRVNCVWSVSNSLLTLVFEPPKTCNSLTSKNWILFFSLRLLYCRALETEMLLSKFMFLIVLIWQEICMVF